MLDVIEKVWNGTSEVNVIDTDGRVDVGSWKGNVPADLHNTYVQTDAKEVSDAAPMTGADVNVEADIALTDYDPPTRGRSNCR